MLKHSIDVAGRQLRASMLLICQKVVRNILPWSQALLEDAGWLFPTFQALGKIGVFALPELGSLSELDPPIFLFVYIYQQNQ
jgi:hypothetical protein